MFGKIKLLASIPSAKQARAAERQGLLDACNELSQENQELRLELEMTEDLLVDAARIANARGETLRQVSATIDSVNSPNGTTRKLGRIVAPAVAEMKAKTLDQMSATEVFVVETR